MLRDAPILVVEDNVYLAMDLTAAIEQLQGRVVGPVGRVADALAILDRDPVAGAVIDYELPDSDVRPLVAALREKGVPYVIQTSQPVDPDIAINGPTAAPVLMRPIQPLAVAAVLGYELARSELI